MLRLGPSIAKAFRQWRKGDKIPLTAERTLRVLGVRDDRRIRPPALVVEDLHRPLALRANAT
jgi:hypothetical protein